MCVGSAHSSGCVVNGYGCLFYDECVCVGFDKKREKESVCVCVQEYVNDHPQWVKVISPEGVVHHQPWSRVYNDMMRSAEIRSQGWVCV